MPDNAPTFTVEEAQIIFRNFSGKEGQYNREGNREFSIILDEANAEKLLLDNWNVKYLNPREEGDAPVPYITVAVNFKQRPPRITMITSTGRVMVSEDMVGSLDWADIRQADLVCRGYQWEVGDKKGVKAYLKTLFVTIEEDELERKYGFGDEGYDENV